MILLSSSLFSFGSVPFHFSHIVLPF
jgi:hypothetical protein